jgi:putative ABC transport system permease protein
MSFLMTNRIPEIGVRLAIGATRGHVMRTVFRDTAVVVLCDTALGVPLTVATAQLASSMLFGVSAADPFTIGFFVLLMGTVAGAAVFVPAWRASRVDPISALRTD